MFKVYCYSRCSTCQKALRWLEQHKLACESVDLKSAPPTKDELQAYHKRSGLELRKMFNTSGKLYRELQLSVKLKSMGDEEQLELLASDGMLVKRPLLVDQDSDLVLVGFKEAEWQEKLR